MRLESPGLITCVATFASLDGSVLKHEQQGPSAFGTVHVAAGVCY